MKNEIINKIKELSYEDALEIRKHLNEHISEKETLIKALLSNDKDSTLEPTSKNEQSKKSNNHINEHTFKCVLCGNIGLHSHGIHYSDDEFDDTLYEFYSCESKNCRASYKRELSRDPYDDDSEIVLYKR